MSTTPTNPDQGRVRVAAGHDVMLRVAGKRFACECGCNVFQNPEGEPDTYKCNSCDAIYEAYE